MENISGQ